MFENHASFLTSIPTKFEVDFRTPRPIWKQGKDLPDFPTSVHINKDSTELCQAILRGVLNPAVYSTLSPLAISFTPKPKEEATLLPIKEYLLIQNKRGLFVPVSSPVNRVAEIGSDFKANKAQYVNVQFAQSDNFYVQQWIDSQSPLPFSPTPSDFEDSPPSFKNEEQLAFSYETCQTDEDFDEECEICKAKDAELSSTSTQDWHSCDEDLPTGQEAVQCLDQYHTIESSVELNWTDSDSSWE